MPDPIARLSAALQGRYRIERQLGEGGMATVYLARDLKHNRNVALKVLKPELAAVVGADRFLAEIETTANLQHPHILPLFDSGEADGFLFYVMPYVEGESLRERLDREHQLPVDEAVQIAKNVAEALDYAHRHSVIHRDIKPANILLQDGKPVVSDFGIALAVGAAGGGRLTETGLSLGTPHYMSPEQATGDLSIGAASDIYALGCVLYEMLVAEPPYTGGTPQAILGKIVTGDAEPVTRHRRSVPPNVDAAIRKALEKVPADRFSRAVEFAQALADPAFAHGLPTLGGGGAAVSPWNRLSITVTGLAALLSVALGWALLRPAPEPVRRVQRFSNPFLPGQEHSSHTGTSGSDLSPDGSMLVYRFDTDDGQILMIRRWDDLTADPVRETSAGLAPAISLDGRELAFEQGEEIKVLDIAGGPVRTLLTGRQPEWGPEGYVYATTDSGTVRVPSQGGAVEYLSRLEEGDAAQFVRDVLPDGRHALLDVAIVGTGTEIRSLDLRDGRMKPLTFGTMPRYASTGHLLYLSEGTLMAVPFDPGDMELLGTPVAVLDGVSNFSLADDGTLYYVPGAGRGSSTFLQLAWAGADGDVTPLDPSWTFDRGSDLDQNWSLSPDASLVALRQFSASGFHIWVRNLDTNTSRQITFGDAHDKWPVWNPDGLRVTFLSDRGGNFDVWERLADGTGQDELILDLEENLARVSWSPNGEWLILQTEGPDSDILAYRPGTDSEPTRLLAGNGNQTDPAVSPDGRWIAYASDESATWEVYVSPFPDVRGGKWLVSLISGYGPKWARSGRVLFFDSYGQGQPMMSAEVIDGGAAFDNRTPTVAFGGGAWFGSARTSTVYEVTPDDGKLLVGVGPVGGASGDLSTSPVLVDNFFEELNRLVPTN